MVAIANGRVTPVRSTVDTEEMLSPPLFVASAEEDELKESITDNGLEIIAGFPADSQENCEKRSLKKLGTANLPDFLVQHAIGTEISILRKYKHRRSKQSAQSCSQTICKKTKASMGDLRKQQVDKLHGL